MQPIRILQVVPAMDCGGMETFIMNIYRNIDRKKIQFDFLYHYNKSCYFDDEITELGGNIFKLSVRQDNRMLKYLIELKHFFDTHHYSVIHGHYSGFGLFYNHFAAKAGVRCLIGHSHSDSFSGVIDKCLSRFFRYGLTQRFACSQHAGKVLFGSMPFEIIPNGVDTSRFAFDANESTKIRHELGITDNALVIGNVGRFDAVKNHMYLLEIFLAILELHPMGRLLLVGKGALEKQLKSRATELGIADKVIFAGLRSDVEKMYCAMDILIMPSIYEGIPLVCTEAQASGLPCLLSDTVSEECNIAGNVKFLSLKKPARIWADTALEMMGSRCKNGATQVASAGYDIASVAEKLEQFYLTQAKNSY